MAATAPPRPRGTPAEPTAGPPTASDTRNLKRRARAADAGYEHAYQLGLAGEDPPFNATDAELDAHAAGVEERQRRQRTSIPASTSPGPAPAPLSGRPGPGRSTSGPSSSGSGFRIGQQGASAVAGLVAYALVINYLRYGTAGVTSWLSAKFLNKPTLGQSPPPAAAPPPNLSLPPLPHGYTIPVAPYSSYGGVSNPAALVEGLSAALALHNAGYTGTV